VRAAVVVADTYRWSAGFFMPQGSRTLPRGHKSTARKHEGESGGEGSTTAPSLLRSAG
jgi:hypothetical protein